MSRLNQLLVFIVILVLPLFSTGFAQGNGDEVSLQMLIAEALEKNPRIKAAERRWRASEFRPKQVSALPDPMLSYSRFISSVETRVGPQENILTLSQRIPFPGKLGLKGKMAEQDALVDEQTYLATQSDVILTVKQAYYDLYRIDQSLTILSQYLEVLKGFTRVAEQKYATGQGIQANVLKSQVEISSVLERKLEFEKVRHHVAVRLNALLDRPTETELGRAAGLDTIRIDLDGEQLVISALAHRQELLATRAMIEKSTFMKKLAGKNYLPDFRFQANYIDISEGISSAPDVGKNAWSVELGLNLPIWLGKRTAATREAEEILASNQLEYDNVENRVRSEVIHLIHELHMAKQTLRLYEEGLLTQAESSFESAMAGYRTGKLDFLNLLDAERTLLNLNLSYVKERVNYQKQLAALERAIGSELPKSQ